MQRQWPASIIAPIAIALAVLALAERPALAQTADSLVGAWYGELAVSESKDGRPINFRRWVRVNRPDGTQTITFRFYFDKQLQWEQVWDGVWGYSSGMYWTQCRYMIVNGQRRRCADRRTYAVLKVDTREMVYMNKATGERFTTTRVPDDYRLP